MATQHTTFSKFQETERPFSNNLSRILFHLNGSEVGNRLEIRSSIRWKAQRLKRRLNASFVDPNQPNIIQSICVRIKWKMWKNFSRQIMLQLKCRRTVYHIRRNSRSSEWISFHLNYHKIWDEHFKENRVVWLVWDKLHAGKTFAIKSVFRTTERTNKRPNRDRNKFLLMAMKNHTTFETRVCVCVSFSVD